MTPYTLLHGHCVDVLREMPADSVQACITSPPYWGLRNYQAPGQIGLEPTLEAHLAALVEVFREVRRVLHPRGTLWLNYGSMYANDGGGGTQGETGQMAGRAVVSARQGTRLPAGYKSKDLILMDARIAMALQADGWYLRSEIIWHKPNSMPESAADRPMRDYEKLFLFSKSEHYHYDRRAVLEPFRSDEGKRSRQRWISGWRQGAGPHTPIAHNVVRMRPKGGAATTLDTNGRLLRTVWTIASQPFKGAHFATFPPRLPERCVLLTSKPGDLILDPFCGAGTTGLVALRHGRRFVGIDVNEAYLAMARERFERERWMWDRKAVQA